MQPFAKFLYRTSQVGFGAQDTSGAGGMSFARSEKFGKVRKSSRGGSWRHQVKIAWVAAAASSASPRWNLKD